MNEIERNHQWFIDLVKMMADEFNRVRLAGGLRPFNVAAVAWRAMCVDPNMLFEGASHDQSGIYGAARGFVTWAVFEQLPEWDDQRGNSRPQKPPWVRYVREPFDDKNDEQQQ